MHTFTPLGNCVFLPSAVPQARISPSDILSIFPSSDNISFAGGMLELPPKAYSEFIELSSRMQEKYEAVFFNLGVWEGEAAIVKSRHRCHEGVYPH